MLDAKMGILYISLLFNRHIDCETFYFKTYSQIKLGGVSPLITEPPETSFTNLSEKEEEQGRKKK